MSEPATQRSSSPPKSAETEQGGFWELVRTLALVAAVALSIRFAIVQPYRIEGPSMEPTLLDGDQVFVAKFAYGFFPPFGQHALLHWADPDLGDVVILNSPADGKDIVKRVVGVAGDTIEVRDHVVWRNGHPVPRDVVGPCQHETVYPGPCMVYRERIDGITYEVSRTPGPSTPFASGSLANAPAVKVPPGYVYVLGDHRDHSNDSRAIGVIPVDRIAGRVLFVWFSMGRHGIRWSRLGHVVH